MKIVILGIVIIIMYGGLTFFTLRNQAKEAKVSFICASVVSFSILTISAFVNLFWALFVAAFIICITLFINSARKETNGMFIKNGVFGVFGGLWLLIPIYAYLALST